MPAYCTPDDLIQRFGATEVAQLVPLAPGMEDTEAVQRACDDATDIVNGYLAARHTLPLSSVPRILNRLTLAIARYELHLGGDRQPTEQVKQNRDDAIAFLKDVAAGRADLGIDDGGETPVETSGGVRFGRGNAGLSEGDLAAYRGVGPLS